ncbi:TlpA family protein disulfide reductase [Corynebacterium casei]|uniref:TlpA family protein disulfide reductase n=1 Tax=Corynebacterium casei TaxID=160386 RepID=UPI002647DA35|nr:TlpA disulfide reductase family protein [Corynebacterium casei]MDN5729214.1 TlpA family protein disulfide reductase [Corynebacterium casei]MDN5740775.1 TlpA family protein disulfide reductase [Corynebacterium casei]MDN5883975.1 TlpA family protein disulfide reductase [Corynebacterium casei]MDN6154983.1 TlpA family protein disulfide reductase [Corynebacterium casei]MDN6263136.1 TlpA family protein disulfide reductase [Corynebacterium casei]
MKKSVVLSVVVAIVLTIGVIFAAMSILNSDSGSTPEDVNAEGTVAEETAATEASGQAEVGEETRSSNSAPDNMPQRPDCPAELVAGVELPCLGGDMGDAKATDEGISIVNIWAWWCEPCREELPYLEQVAESHPEWNVVGVHADRNAGNGAAFLNDLGVDLPSYQDDSNLFAGTLALPGVIPITLLVVDGEVQERFIRPFTSAEEIETSVTEALG